MDNIFTQRILGMANHCKKNNPLLAIDIGKYQTFWHSMLLVSKTLGQKKISAFLLQTMFNNRYSLCYPKDPNIWEHSPNSKQRISGRLQHCSDDSQYAVATHLICSIGGQTVMQHIGLAHSITVHYPESKLLQRRCSFCPVSQETAAKLFLDENEKASLFVAYGSRS